MTFRVGQKVVCVDASGEEHLEAGKVYEVTRTNHLPCWINVSCCSQHAQMDGAGWDRRRFRPIVERATDISVFTEILRKASKPARTPAMSQHYRSEP